MDGLVLLPILRSGKSAVGISETDPGNSPLKWQEAGDFGCQHYGISRHKSTKLEILGERGKNTARRIEKFPDLIAGGVQRGIDLPDRQLANRQVRSRVTEPGHRSGGDQNQADK